MHASARIPTFSPHRRRLLGGALAGVAVLGASGCATRARAFPDGTGAHAWPRPDLDPSLVIREVAGLRPFRPAGFRVEPERVGDQLVIHHYGHGGCGVTLSWGTADLVLRHALAQPERQAAVLGCGAVGLATARLLQDHGFAVTIYARELPPDTVSNIAGAQFGPSGLLDREYRSDAFASRLAHATRFAHRRFQLLPGERYGVRWMPLYMASRRSEWSPGWEWSLTPELFQARTHAPGTHPFGPHYLHELQTMIIEPTIYLPAMTDAFRLAGGRLEVRGFDDVAQIRALPERLVVNCTGLGARTLFGDASMQPVKGQLVVVVPQPAIDYAVIAPGSTYLFPRRDGLQLGGSHARGDDTQTVDAAVSADILRRHRELFSTR